VRAVRRGQWESASSLSVMRAARRLKLSVVCSEGGWQLGRGLGHTSWEEATPLLGALDLHGADRNDGQFNCLCRTPPDQRKRRRKRWAHLGILTLIHGDSCFSRQCVQSQESIRHDSTGLLALDTRDEWFLRKDIRTVRSLYVCRRRIEQTRSAQPRTHTASAVSLRRRLPLPAFQASVE
jgi:hypothetical protein